MSGYQQIMAARGPNCTTRAIEERLKKLKKRANGLMGEKAPHVLGSNCCSQLCPGSVVTANGHTGETLNTLKFAARAKNNIVSHAKKAEGALGGGTDAGSRVLLERYRMEIQSFTRKMEAEFRAKRETETAAVQRRRAKAKAKTLPLSPEEVSGTFSKKTGAKANQCKHLSNSCRHTYHPSWTSPRPPPQEKPAIHPNYTQGEEIRSYHNPSAQNSNPQAPINPQQGNSRCGKCARSCTTSARPKPVFTLESHPSGATPPVRGSETSKE